MFGQAALVARPLFHTSKKESFTSVELESCHYCLIKQKFSGPNQKCVEHTIKGRESGSGSESSASQDLAMRIVDLLSEAEECIEEYWNSLHARSKGSYKKAKEELTDVVEALKRIEQKLEKFPLETSFNFQFPEINRTLAELPEEKKMATRSQKFITSNFSQLFEDISINDQIKQWVVYFHKITVNRELNEEILPLDEQVDMRIFKESMERKFLTFARNYSKFEQRLGQALEKLLFYMQKFGSSISESTLNEDLLFLEESEAQPKAETQVDNYPVLLMQALSIEHLLADKQGEQRLSFE